METLWRGYMDSRLLRSIRAIMFCSAYRSPGTGSARQLRASLGSMMGDLGNTGYFSQVLTLLYELQKKKKIRASMVVTGLIPELVDLHRPHSPGPRPSSQQHKKNIHSPAKTRAKM